MSLRTRLVLGTLALATLGLLVADIVTYTSLRSFLVNQVDSSLQSDHIAVEQNIAHGSGPCGGFGNLDPEVFVQRRTLDGTVLCTKAAADQSRLTPPSSEGPRGEAPDRPAPAL